MKPPPNDETPIEWSSDDIAELDTAQAPAIVTTRTSRDITRVVIAASAVVTALALVALVWIQGDIRDEERQQGCLSRLSYTFVRDGDSVDQSELIEAALAECGVSRVKP
jgi:hypothetical protein